GMKPSAGESFSRCLLVLEVPLHHDVAAEHDLADGFAVARHLAHRFRVKDGDGFLERVRNTLPSLELGALIAGEVVPTGLFGADRGRTVGLRQPVDMSEFDTDAF